MRRKLLIAAAIFAGLGLLGMVATLVYWNWFLCRGNACPTIAALDRYLPRQPARLYAADGRFIAEVGLERRSVVTLGQIPKHVTNAFVMTEDRRFYKHSGIDYPRVVGALWVNLRALSFAEGFSTITMQLARNIFPEQLPSRSKAKGKLDNLARKFREAKVARAIERKYSKDRILELYLNQISLGSGAFGVEAAAQRYFGKSVGELTVAEGATLAALPKAPSRYNPRRFPERAVQRRNTILELMRRQGGLSDADASVAKAYPLRLARRMRGNSGEVAPYFVEWVRAELEQRFGQAAYERGLRVTTSLDFDMQGAAERAMERQLRSIEAGQYGPFPHRTYEEYLARAATGGSDENTPISPYLQGAFVAMDPRSGAVRALVGGRDFEDSKFDRAIRALRQPGSTFKPIVYAAGVHTGRPPSYFLEDEPVEVPQVDGTTWTPSNFDNKSEGRISMRRALYQSRNLPAIRLGMEIGEDGVIEMARNFGLTTPIPPYPSIHIGSADVHPLQMISSYAVFANLGWRVPPTPILRVETVDGEVLWESEPERIQVLSREEAWLMVDMMKDVVRRGSAFNSVWNGGFQLPAGGKTGTTNDYTDVWYIGYTTDLVAGAWMGFDQPKRIKANAQGGQLAAPAWTAFMREVYARKPASPDWPRPAGILALDIDLRTGLLRGPGCGSDSTAIAYFLPGTEPTAECGRRGFFR